MRLPEQRVNVEKDRKEIRLDEVFQARAEWRDLLLSVLIFGCY